MLFCKGDSIRFLNQTRHSANAVCVKIPGGQLKLAGPRERPKIARGQFEGGKDNNLRNNPELYRAVRDNSRKRGGARLLTPERKAVLNYVGQLLDFALGGDWYFGYSLFCFFCDEQSVCRSTSKGCAVHFQELAAEQQLDLVQLLRQAYPKAQFSKDEAINGPPLLSFGPCAVINALCGTELRSKRSNQGIPTLIFVYGFIFWFHSLSFE